MAIKNTFSTALCQRRDALHLTQEQVELIHDILERNLPGPQRDNLT